MPRKNSPEEPEKVQRLSLAELAAHDDVCSDAMIDNAYFKSKIRKNRGKHIPIRGIKEDDVPQILLHKVICDKDPTAAEKALLKLPGLKRYKHSLRSKPEKENFLNHLRKYVRMYMTDCPWEVSTTNRYTITTYEAAVTARRRIKQGEMIPYLTGTMVPLTMEESANLDLTNRNFSIVVSSRKKNSSIFLGPARFANHDCDANGRLIMKGKDGMEVIAMKNIEVGDEITVSYGDDYFGPRNIDCLCHTCEVLERNGWTSKTALMELQSGTTTPEPTAQKSSSKRKREEVVESGNLQEPLSKRSKIQTSPSKLQQAWTPPATSDSDMAQDDALEGDRTSARETLLSFDENTALSPPGSPVLSNSESDPAKLNGLALQFDDRPLSTTSSGLKKSQKVERMSTRLLGNLSLRRSLPLSPTSTILSSQDLTEIPEHNLTRSKTTSRGSVVVKLENVEKSQIERDAPPDCGQRSNIKQKSNSEGMYSPKEPASRGDVVSVLSTTKISTSLNAASGNGDESTVLPSIEPVTSTTTIAKMTVQPVFDSVRVPGDYLLTRKLLAQPHDRWVRCHNEKCLGFFIQPNGYQTRRECPRCERHSMLYGFPWPKTDPDPRKLLERKKELSMKNKKGAPVVPTSTISAYRRQGRCGKGTWVEGGGDEEERVMDHRIVHRFVLPDEEKELTRKGLLLEAEQLRANGDDHFALGLGEQVEGRRRARASLGLKESVARETSESGSATPDEARRRSNRFVPNRVYADAY